MVMIMGYLNSNSSRRSGKSGEAFKNKGILKALGKHGWLAVVAITGRVIVE